ncbi:helix-turn-helix domain-containing protein [Bacteroides ovatus]|nr:helix-turn-helix domain-containing protein [Bacteroides ovatus]
MQHAAHIAPVNKRYIPHKTGSHSLWSGELLREGEYRINEVCFIVGFNNPSYFARCFQKQFGILPKDYVKKGS